MLLSLCIPLLTLQYLNVRKVLAKLLGVDCNGVQELSINMGIIALCYHMDSQRKQLSKKSTKQWRDLLLFLHFMAKQHCKNTNKI